MRSTRSVTLLLPLAVLTALSAPTAYARSKFQGYAERGGQTVLTSLAGSTVRAQRSFPGAQYDVFNAGTTTPATIYSDIAGTPKVCPCAADSAGWLFFYGDAASYDVRFSPSAYVPWTITGFGATGGVGSGLLVSIQDFGAKCDSVTDDTAAIQSALSFSGAHTVAWPSAACRSTDTLTINQHRVNIVGQGKQSSALFFDPSITGKPAIALAAASGILVQNSITGLSIYCSSTPGVQKIGIRATDTSELAIRDVAINPFTSNGNSIALQYRGREFLILDNFEASADQGISIEDNPNSSIDIDHAHLSNLYILNSANVPCVKFASGVNVSNLLIDGNNACVGGSDCIQRIDTTSVQTSSVAHISGWRWEQPLSAGWTVDWEDNVTFRGLDISDMTSGSGASMKGYKLRKVNVATIRNVEYVGTSTALDADSSNSSLSILNVYMLAGSSTSLSGMRRVFALNKPQDTAPEWRTAIYDSTTNASLTSGFVTNIGGLTVAAKSGVPVLAGAGNRVPIECCGGGSQTAGYISVSCRGTTLTSGGAATFSSLGATCAACSDANFNVGNVAGKLTVFWESAAVISIMNQTAENMTCGYYAWWF